MKWNRDIFGRVEVEIRKLEDGILCLEEEVSRSFSMQAERDLMDAKQAHL